MYTSENKKKFPTAKQIDGFYRNLVRICFLAKYQKIGSPYNSKPLKRAPKAPQQTPSCEMT